MKFIFLLMACVTGVTPLLRATPQTLSVHADDTVPGQATTFTATATDPDQEIVWLHFYVNGPGLPGWNYAGSTSVSGHDATGSITWTPSEGGGYAVHVRAENTSAEWDWNANMANTFSVNVPNANPQTHWVNASDTVAGQPTTFTANASDPDGNLTWFHFYVNGPNLPGWNYAGSVQVSSGDATASITWTPSEPGSFAVHVRAEDSWGWWDSNANVANVFTVNAPFDSSPPTIPDNLTAGLVTASSFKLSWSASADDVGVAGYDVAVGDTTYWSDGTNLLVAGLAPDTTYGTSVRARDAAGNLSGWNYLSVRTSSGAPAGGDQSAWIDVNGDGILDEVIAAQSSRFSYYFSAWSTYSADFSPYIVNNYWQSSDVVWPNGDQNPNFSSQWTPIWFFYPSHPDTTTYFDLNFNLSVEPGNDYRIYVDSTGSTITDPANWSSPSALGGLLNWPAGLFHTVRWENVNADVIYGRKFFFVRFGKPSAGNGAFGSASNVLPQGDDGSIFLSWTNPSGPGFTSSIVAWSTDDNLTAALNDPSRRAETKNGFFTIEGLANGTPYHVWVVSRWGNNYAAAVFATVTADVPPGYRVAPNPALADTDLEEAEELERKVVQNEKQVIQKSSEYGSTLRAMLARFNASLAMLGSVLQHDADVKLAARHVGVRIAREAWLKGEITAAQYAGIADFIINAITLSDVGVAQGGLEGLIKKVTDETNAHIAQAKTANQNNERCPNLIHRFGGSPIGPNPRPSRAKPEKDFDLPANSPGSVNVGPQFLPFPDGASAFGDVYKTSFIGWYYSLPKGTVLPLGIGIVADGVDVRPDAPHGETHHTIYPTMPMSLDRFNDLMRTLPWSWPPAQK